MTKRVLVKVVVGVFLAACGATVLSLVPHVWATGNELAAHGAQDGEFAVKLYAVGGAVAGLVLIGAALFGIPRVKPYK